MKQIKFNINNYITFTLTDKGAEIWNANEYKYAGHRFITPNYKRSGEIMRCQAWEVFQVFGASIYLGCVVPFEHCELLLEIGE